MLIEIGFRPNNLFISNSSKHFPISSPSYAQISHASNHDAKSRQAFFNSSRKKKLIKRSLTMPYAEEGSREAARTPITKCIETIENDLDRMGGKQQQQQHNHNHNHGNNNGSSSSSNHHHHHHHSVNPFKGIRLGRKEGAAKGKSQAIEPFIGNSSSTRVAVEFPLILNVGSIYSSHVVVYLDP